MRPAYRIRGIAEDRRLTDNTPELSFVNPLHRSEVAE
jgi:hypothetical protein